MRNLIISLALIVTFLLPCYGQAPNEYVAIYCSQDREHRYKKPIFKHRIDSFCSAKDWRSFEPFLREVKEKSAGRPIALNLCIHGLDVVPVLAVGTDKTSYVATEGAVISLIEDILGDQVKAVIQETCHGSVVYHGSINPGAYLLNPKNKKCLLLPRTKGNPSFPVYGFEDFSNPIPCAMEQYLHSSMTTLIDLRQYKDQAPKHLDPQLQEISKILNYMILENLSKLDK